jgi:hypothetical protein
MICRWTSSTHVQAFYAFGHGCPKPGKEHLQVDIINSTLSVALGGAAGTNTTGRPDVLALRTSSSHTHTSYLVHTHSDLSKVHAYNLRERSICRWISSTRHWERLWEGQLAVTPPAGLMWLPSYDRRAALIYSAIRLRRPWLQHRKWCLRCWSQMHH